MVQEGNGIFAKNLMSDRTLGEETRRVQGNAFLLALKIDMLTNRTFS